MNIIVRLKERSYPIVVADSYAQLGRALQHLRLPRHAVVVSHEPILARYGRALLGPLAKAGWRLKTVAVPESETSKSLRVAADVIARVAQGFPMQTPLLLAFGGGVVGDLTGFVAAVFRRGVPYVQLPTTLLAQVDSAIGGKVGVDLPNGKNLAGAFYQPRLVWNQTALLRSLPPRQIRSGLSEIIKYGVIADEPLFCFLEDSLEDCLSLKPSAVHRMIARSCAIKARVVSQDEVDARDVRIRLNFGHTIGHAIEASSEYRLWTHGEAIAVGMCAASRMSQELGLWPAASHQRLQALIAAVGLPTHACGLSAARVLRHMRFDKKFTHGKMRWVLPSRIGRVVVREDVPPALMRRVVAEFIRAKPAPGSFRRPS